MIKHHFLCISFLLFLLTLPHHSISKSTTFERYFGGELEDYGYCVDQTADDGYIIGGSIRINEINTQAIIIKTDEKGNEQWQKTFGGDHSEFIMDVKALPDGYLFAMFSNSNLGNNFHLFLIKTDKSGDEIWKTRWDGPGASPLSASIFIAKEGHYFISAGYMNKLVPHSGILSKVHKSGTREWAHVMYNETITCVRQAADGGIYLTGFHQEAGKITSWLAEFDIDGGKSWRKPISSGYIFSMDITQDDGIIAAGLETQQENANLIPFLVKADQKGRVQWSRHYNAQVSESHISVISAGKSSYVFTSLQTNPKTMTDNLILVKTDELGKVYWWRNYGTSESTERGVCVLKTRDKGFIVAGITNRFKDNQNIYLLKTDESGLAALAVANRDSE